MRTYTATTSYPKPAAISLRIRSRAHNRVVPTKEKFALAFSGDTKKKMDNKNEKRSCVELNWFARALARVPSWPCGRNKKPHIILQAETVIHSRYVRVEQLDRKQQTSWNWIEDHPYKINIIWKSITGVGRRCYCQKVNIFASLTSYVTWVSLTAYFHVKENAVCPFKWESFISNFNSKC